MVRNDYRCYVFIYLAYLALYITSPFLMHNQARYRRIPDSGVTFK